MSRDSSRWVSRRKLLKSAGVVGVGAIAGCLGGDEEAPYPDPDRSITAMVPFGPGGGFDWYTRTVAKYAEQYLPTDTIIVAENVEGAGGLFSLETLWQEEPDGYTYLLTILRSAVFEQIAANPDWDLLEFTTLSTVASVVNGIAQATHVEPIENFDDLKSAATTHRIAASGPSDTTRLSWIIYGELTGEWGVDDLDFVYYEGGTGEVMSAFDREEVELWYAPVASNQPFVEDGVAAHVAQVAVEPDPAFSDVPVLGDFDIPSELRSFLPSLRGPRPFLAPPGLPEDRRRILEEALVKAMNDEAFVAEAEEADRSLHVLDADETEEMISAEIENWSQFEEMLREIE